jgi:hypothetical protein
LLNSHLNNKLFWFREFIGLALDRRNLINALAVNATTADSAFGILFKNDGWCPIWEAKVAFTARDAWFRDHYRCDRCGSISCERAPGSADDLDGHELLAKGMLTS